MTTLASGQIVADRYTIDRVIGEGGMQIVYAAHDDTLERSVALKVPKDASAARRFHESAVLSARVNHPNVASTLDYFEDSERFYLVEELIEGEDLRQMFSRFERFRSTYRGLRAPSPR